MYCFLRESPPLSKQEEKKLTRNQNLVALKGKKPGLNLGFNGKEKTLTSWASLLIEGMLPVAKLLDTVYQTNRYSTSLNEQQKKVDDPSKTPSEQVLSHVLESSYRDFGIALARKHREESLQKNCPKSFEEELDKLAMKSIEEQEALELHDDFSLKGYEDLELSTQALLREAWKRGCDVEELVRKSHIFRFTKGDQVQVVKNATMTSLDSLITYWEMENKEVTKKLLAENGLSIPQGILCYDSKEALKQYDLFRDQKLIIKPNRMNYGIGIFTVEANDQGAFGEAVGKAFEHGQEVVIETFLKGEEYRFLVIDGKVVAICQRIPANVIGDGVHSIGELIQQKNQDPKAYKIPKYYLREGEDEAKILSRQGMSFETVPKEGQQVFIRENSNVSTGGDSIDKTDQVHPGYSEVAVQAAKVMDATFCGVDVMIIDPKKPPTSDNHGIIELNFNPALWIHRYPTAGAKRYVERNVLDALGFK